MYYYYYNLLFPPTKVGIYRPHMYMGYTLANSSCIQELQLLLKLYETTPVSGQKDHEPGVYVKKRPVLFLK